MDRCDVPGCDRPARISRHQRSGDVLRVCGEPHVYPSTCPTCGYAGREANVYRWGRTVVLVQRPLARSHSTKPGTT